MTKDTPEGQPQPQYSFEHICGVRYENIGMLKIQGKERGPFYRCLGCGYLWLKRELEPTGACTKCQQLTEAQTYVKKQEGKA